MQVYLYDDRNVTWQTVEAIGAQIYVLAVDEAQGIVDALIRFHPNTPGRMHRHVCDFSTLVLQGELRFWRPDGSLKEVRPTGSYVQVAANGEPVRPTGSYVQVAANGEPHSEGAGDQTAIVLFSFRRVSSDMILYLDKTTDVSFRLGLPEFKATLAHQIATGATAKLGARAA